MHRVLIAFEPPDGGVAEHVLQLALGLPKHGWTAEVAGPEEATIYARLESAGVPVHRTALERGFGRPWLDVRASRELHELMRDGRFDLAHCHAAKAGAIGRPVARVTRIPVVYTPHCFGFVGDVGAFRRVAVAAAERVLGWITDRLVCVCDAELRVAEMHRIGSPSRRRRVYNAAEPCDGYRESPALLSSWRRRGPVVGTIAVFRRQKRIDVFLDAAPRVLREVPDCSLAVIGDGPLRDELRARADALGLSAEPRFAFLPFEPPSAPYLRELDLFVLPSSWEAFPMSLLEALACGVPQVATDVGGTREAVSDETAILVPPDSADRLAEATIELLREPTRRAAMAAASTARYRQLFRVGRMVEETAQVYESVTGR
jgi:glycosyltransferase involved in cell wall biosynthesis